MTKDESSTQRDSILQQQLANNVDNQQVPVETEPVETVPVGTEPLESATVETAPVETAPVETATLESGDIQKRNENLNYKALRQSKKQAEKERDEYALKLRRLEQFQLEHSRVENSKVENSKSEQSGDDLADDLARTRNEFRDFKAKWNKQQNQLKLINIEQQLKQNFPDFENVINEENIDVLKARDTNFAKATSKAIAEPDELYHRAVAAYTLIKRYGIYVKDEHQGDRARVAKNMAKPRPASASAQTESLADFASFSTMNEEERRKAIFKVARERANS